MALLLQTGEYLKVTGVDKNSIEYLIFDSQAHRDTFTNAQIEEMSKSIIFNHDIDMAVMPEEGKTILDCLITKAYEHLKVREEIKYNPESYILFPDCLDA